MRQLDGFEAGATVMLRGDSALRIVTIMASGLVARARQIYARFAVAAVGVPRGDPLLGARRGRSSGPAVVDEP
jgi:hypothetical protein